MRLFRLLPFLLPVSILAQTSPITATRSTQSVVWPPSGTLTFPSITIAAGTFSGAGGGLTLDASGFNGNLATTDNTLQEIAQKLDDLVAGGATKWNAIGDPDGNNSVALGNFTTIFTTTLDNGIVWEISDTDADAAADTTLLKLSHNDGADANVIYLSMIGDKDGTPTTDYVFSQFQAEFSKPLTVNDDITSTGLVAAASLSGDGTGITGLDAGNITNLEAAVEALTLDLGTVNVTTLNATTFAPSNLTITAAGPQVILGANATTLGSIKLFGNTSGDLTLRPTAAAGTGTVMTFQATTGTVYSSGGTDVAVADGGTGASTLTGLLQGNGTSAITGITNSSTAGQILRVTGVSTYAWGALDLADTDAVTGTLPAGNVATLNQNTTGSAASLSISGQTGLLTFTGPASTNRAKTVRDAADTILELGGSYAPTGIWTGLIVGNGSTGPGYLDFREDTDNGTNRVRLIGPASTADADVTLPAATDTLVGKATTDTLTNKRITKRVVTTADDATAVIDGDITDVYQLSAVANATEFTITGTPTDGQQIIVRYKDAGAAKGLTWTGITAIGVTLPTTTTTSKWGYVGLTYNSAASAWHAIAVTTEQ